jgi:hypothetical protein
MPAPTPTARQAPTGIKLDDGYQTLVAFEADPDEIDTTTMHNVTWRTRNSRALRTLTEFTMTAAYDPNLYNSVLALVNQNTVITIHYPDTSTLAFWGFLKGFESGDLVEGEQPEITITVVPTNQDNAGAEQAPVLTSAAGT